MTDLLMPPVDSDLMAGGHRLRVRRLRLREEPAGTPTLVFLHEGLGSIRQWRDFPQALAEELGLPTMLYDRFGYGASEAREGPQDPLYLGREARTLPEVLAGCGITRPVLVGHSDGGTIALLYAALHPEAPRAVIVEAAHVFVEDEAVRGVARAVEAYRATALREQLRRHHGDKVDSVFSGWAEVWLDPGHRAWRMEDRLKAITAPLLAIQGADDEYGTPAQVEAIVAGVAGPARSLLLPGCGHVPHFQAADRVLPAMAGFLRETLGLP